MKNTWIFLLFAGLLISSCDKTDLFSNDTIIESETSTILDTELLQEGVFPSYQKYKLLGFSYDVTKEYLDKTAYKKPVIDIESLSAANPYSIVSNPETGGVNHYYYGFTAREYLNDIVKKNNISLNLSVRNESLSELDKKLLAGSITNIKDLQTKHSFSTKYGFASVDFLKYINAWRIEETASIMSNYVTSSFLTDLETLEPDAFVAMYGTHVLTDITMGGVLRLVYKAVSKDQSSTSVRTNIVRTGLKSTLKSLRLGFDNTLSLDESLTSNNYDAELYIRYKGGEGTDVSVFVEKNTALPVINKATWEKSINVNNAQLVDVNWDKTYPIYDFIPLSHSHAVEKIKAAVERYIEKGKLEELELTPVFQWYLPKNGVYAYGTNCTNVHGSDFVNHGIAFWTAKKSDKNTIPVYQWYLPKTGKYAYGLTDIAVHGVGFVNHGQAFLGYQSNDLNSELVDVYQWYLPSTGTYAYGINDVEGHGKGYINHGVAFRAYK